MAKHDGAEASPVGERVALVTGSGAGIGRGIALALAKDGFRVVLNSRSADPANTESGAYEAKAAIERAGGQADVFRGDVAARNDRRLMMEFVEERFGRLDLLVNNAGVPVRQRAELLDREEESFDEILDVNLKSPFFLTQQAAKKMVEWKRQGAAPTPRIAFITSVSAYASSPNRAEYCISKAGLSMAANLFADRLSEHDIPVIEIAPGVIETAMTAGVKDKYDTLISEGLLPTRRWGQPEDVARVVSAFARGDLDYSTGERIEVGGGYGLRRL